MVIGVGVDLIEVPRVKEALESGRTGHRFRKRVYTAGEIDYCEGLKRKYESYAGRFAAKEAVMKSLGVGWGRRAGWLDIEVCSTGTGEPQIRLHDKASARAKNLGIRSFSISLTHTDHYAIAYVIAEGEGDISSAP